jgi:hypothetical protein
MYSDVHSSVRVRTAFKVLSVSGPLFGQEHRSCICGMVCTDCTEYMYIPYVNTLHVAGCTVEPLI